MTRDILERPPFGIMVIDDEGYIEYVNPKMVTFLGYSKEKLLGLNVLEHPANEISAYQWGKSLADTKKCSTSFIKRTQKATEPAPDWR